ncbi:MAG: hypothetical protein ACRDDX_14035 [Cellulosilyticaceae bacterium]
MKTQLTKKLTILGMAILGAVGVLTGCAASVATPNPEPTKTEKPSTPDATSPTGPRKMIDIDGNRFAFLNDGQAFEKEYLQLGEEVGTLNNGKLYKLGNYDSSFRIAFEYEGAYYLCENVGKSDDSTMDIAAYLETAKLESQVIFADILDHMGAHILNAISQEDAAKMLTAFKDAKIVELDEAGHAAIAKAQSEDKSYMLTFMLEDNTLFTSYIIPSMNYITIGDYTCELEGFNEQFGDFFKDLVVPENIIMN